MSNKVNRSVLGRENRSLKLQRKLFESLNEQDYGVSTDEIIDDAKDVLDTAEDVIDAVEVIEDALEDIEDAVVHEHDDVEVIVGFDDEEDFDGELVEDEYFDDYPDNFAIEFDQPVDTEIEFDEVLEDEEEDEDSMLYESVRNRISSRRKNESRGRKIIHRAQRVTEALSTDGLCPSCGSSSFVNGNCKACKAAVNMVRAVESISAEEAELDLVDTLTTDEGTEIFIDPEGGTHAEFDGDVEVLLEEDVVELSIEGEDPIEMSVGTIDIEGDDEFDDLSATVLVFDATSEEVLDMLTEDTQDSVTIEDTEDGFRLLVEVADEDAVLEAEETGMIVEDTEILPLEIIELPEGTAVATDQIHDVDELVDLVNDMLPEDIHVHHLDEDVPDLDSVLDEDEVLEDDLGTPDDVVEEEEEEVLESSKSHKVKRFRRKR